MGKTFWIVEDGKLVRYTRYGSCNMCGKCCCSQLIRAQFTSTLVYDSDVAENIEVDDDDWSEWEGWSAHSQYGLWWWWKFATEDEAKICGSFINGKCESWGSKDFPAICRDWPAHPNDLERFPGCGFSFEREK